MSSPKATALVCLVALLGAPGCWEQMSAEWWPQMKRQIAVQPFEEVLHNNQLQGFVPPKLHRKYSPVDQRAQSQPRPSSSPSNPWGSDPTTVKFEYRIWPQSRSGGGDGIQTVG